MDSIATINKYFPELSKIQVTQFEELGNLFGYWNQHINVVSRKDIDHLYERHVLHSLSIAKYITFKTGNKILDAGTGGGFPGIPLSILFPEVNFHLVDSVGKKIKVVDAIVESLKLKNIMTQQIRAEQLDTEYDFVVSRAVTDLKTFIHWFEKNISETSQNSIANGLLCLKGGDIEDELKGVKQNIEVINLSKYYSEPFFETKKLIHIGF